MLYPILSAIIEGEGGSSQLDLSPNFSKFSYSYTCMLAAVMLFIATLKKDLSIFIRINSFGVIFSLAIIFFVIAMGIYSMSNTNYLVVDLID
jgi:thiol:disulfide interchange protein